MALRGDVLVFVLMSLDDIQTLLQCCCVCTSWKDLIRSRWFRKAWSQLHKDDQCSVLLSFSEDKWNGKRLGVRQWLPPSHSNDSQGKLSPFLDIKIQGFYGRFEIVASSNGIVCACLDYKSFRFAVGNPVTGEWVHLPQPEAFKTHPDRLTTYSLRAHSSGEFKFQVMDCSTADYIMLYSSSTGGWSRSKALVPIPEPAIHDVDEGWISVKPPVQFKNRVVNPRNGNGDSVANLTSWSYKGETYLAGYIHNFDAIPLDHIVWKAEKDVMVTQGGDEEMKSKLWDTGVKEEQVVQEEVVDKHGGDDVRLAYHGEGKLCTFAAYLCFGMYVPGVYDVTSNGWYLINQVGKATNCNRAVVYHPSLIKPDGSTAAVKKRVVKASHSLTACEHRPKRTDASEPARKKSRWIA